MYVLSYVGGGNLLRYAEGATWLAIVTVSVEFTIALFLNYTRRQCGSSKLRISRLKMQNLVVYATLFQLLVLHCYHIFGKPGTREHEMITKREGKVL